VNVGSLDSVELSGSKVVEVGRLLSVDDDPGMVDVSIAEIVEEDDVGVSYLN
jgi:hypothetical protein